MKLECIISLANRAVEYRFLAMVRSLRAVGCSLPVLVIPYDQDTFSLPENCEYLTEQNFFNLLSKYPMAGVKRKYLALTFKNYHFVDSDVVFLKSPEKALQEHNGFITCCGHWRSSDHIATPQLVQFLRKKSTLWQKLIFNSGQFASDQKHYSLTELIEVCQGDEYKNTVLEFPYHEQPGLNMLAHSSSVRYTNLTLPPANLESSWAGDYLDSLPDLTYEKSAYLLHWAGMTSGQRNKCDELYLKYLSNQEKQKLEQQELSNVKIINVAQRIKKSLYAFKCAWNSQH